MQPVGLIEIFYGQPWTKQVRLDYAAFLRENGFGFYLYGPKADRRLRKHWMQEWPDSYVQELRDLSIEYRRNGLKFGVILSPFGLHEEIKKNSATLLKEKIRHLSEIGIDTLGVFFDDMPNTDGLARRQVDVIRIIQSLTDIPLVFCPTFYSFDPALERVFGKMAPDYLDEIGEFVPAGVDILWTGPKVISEEIPNDHLVDVAKLLKRKPFICDNIFANDGPRNCKFIKLKNPSGLKSSSLEHASHWAFNPMNQPELSKLVLRAAKFALESERSGQNHLAAAESYLSAGLADWLRKSHDQLLMTGLDGISALDKELMIKNLSQYKDRAAAELIDWLTGTYTVGSDCLTD